MLRSVPLLFLVSLLATAQTPEIVAKIDAKLDAERSAQRNEDVEILRRLLNKASGLPDRAEVLPHKQPLGGSTATEVPGGLFGTTTLLGGSGRVTATTGNPLHFHTTGAAVGPFDGVYLPGAGVVYTLHVPAGTPLTADGESVGLNQSCAGCHRGVQAHDAHHTSAAITQCASCHDASVGVPAPLSEWERVKQSVRGEKPKEQPKKPEKPKAAVCEPGSLQGQIAAVLAANARNVRHLGEKDGISVVVTFDEVAGGKQVFWQGAMYDDATNTYTTLTPPAPPLLPSKPGFTPAELKSVSLGDLHLKQGKYKEAADAYGEGLTRFTDKQMKLSGLTQMTADQRMKFAEEFQKGVRDAMKSYAKALLLADQPDKAKKALEMATEFVVLEVTPTTVPATLNAPAKLILTLSQADLTAAKDDAGVKKAVKAERVNFPK